MSGGVVAECDLQRVRAGTDVQFPVVVESFSVGAGGLRWLEVEIHFVGEVVQHFGFDGCLDEAHVEVAPVAAGALAERNRNPGSTVRRRADSSSGGREARDEADLHGFQRAEDGLGEQTVAVRRRDGFERVWG